MGVGVPDGVTVGVTDGVMLAVGVSVDEIRGWESALAYPTRPRIGPPRYANAAPAFSAVGRRIRRADHDVAPAVAVHVARCGRCCAEVGVREVGLDQQRRLRTAGRQTSRSRRRLRLRRPGPGRTWVRRSQGRRSHRRSCRLRPPRRVRVRRPPGRVRSPVRGKAGAPGRAEVHEHPACARIPAGRAEDDVVRSRRRSRRRRPAGHGPALRRPGCSP